MNSGPPPVDFFREFWPLPDELFVDLETTVVWDERMKARKTASFGVPYNYSQITYPESAMHSSLEPICRAVAQNVGYMPNNCLLNFYPDGTSSMGFHSDTAEGLEEGTSVSTLSVGAAREIIYRQKSDRGVEHRYFLKSGDLLHMSDFVQKYWLHAIPKAQDTGPRISITFRKLVTDN